MKNCTHCKYAEWQKMASGRLHPSGDGWCKYVFKMPQLPQSMRWISEPKPYGGHINRRKVLDDHCAYYSQV